MLCCDKGVPAAATGSVWFLEPYPLGYHHSGGKAGGAEGGRKDGEKGSRVWGLLQTVRRWPEHRRQPSVREIIELGMEALGKRSALSLSWNEAWTRQRDPKTRLPVGRDERRRRVRRQAHPHWCAGESYWSSPASEREKRPCQLLPLGHEMECVFVPSQGAAAVIACARLPFGVVFFLFRVVWGGVGRDCREKVS